jgi:hypothetical protein
MKITEIKTKFFGLSDLKSLINEYKEGPWPGFFKEDPTRFDVHFNELMGLKAWLEKNGISVPNSKAANALLASLTPEQIEDIKNTVGVDISPIRKYFGDEVFLNALRDSGNFRKAGNNYSPFRSGFIQAIIASNGKQRERYKAKKAQQANANLVQPEVPQDNIDRPTTLNPEYNNVELLKDAFNELGGNEIQVPDFQQAIKTTNYIETIDELSKNVSELVKNKYGKEINDFTINKFLPGTETNPFYFFLLFYYFYNRESGAKMLPQYVGNIKNPDVREYTKYVLGIRPNVYTTVESNINNVKIGWKNILNSAGFGGDEFLTSRSWAYFKAYQKKYNNILNEQLLSKMSQCFSLPMVSLFDPLLNNITDSMIGNGIRIWAGGGDSHILQELIKPQIVTDIDDGCIAEKIFYAARAMTGLMDASYKKYGKIAETSEMTIEFLLMDGMEAINKWNRNKNKEDIPVALVPLKTIYDGKRKLSSTGEVLTEENVPFWRLLNFKNEFKDKTQGEIYYFLVNNSDPSVTWQYEYNRKKKTDTDLLGQSIDILGRTDNRTYCFEYQGEQHYRPLTVTYDDYSAFPLFTEMREYILSECGFIQKTVGGTKFYSGPEDSSAARMHKIREIIIRAYQEFSKRLSSGSLDSGNSVAKIKSRLSEGSFVPTVNKWKTVDGKKERVKFEDDTQLLAYFQSIIRHGADDEEIFNAPEVGGVIPYLGSPRRFLDEVKTAQDMGRDITKRNAIRNSNEKTGWVLSYIIPPYATDDEKEYTVELAGSDEFVFPWSKEGKNKLIGFLHNNNIAAGDQNKPTALNENKTLFEEIIRETLTNYGF